MPALEARCREARPRRVGPLARLPVFLALEGRRALVAGEGPAVAWKAELLAAAGAEVEIFAEHPCRELRAVAAQSSRGAIALHDRAWRDADLSGAAVAVGGFDGDGEAASFARAARAAGVPVNVIDKPAHCDFAFGAIVNRSPLVIGISTDGGAPVFAQAIRARLEIMIPRGFTRWAEAARRWRSAVQSSMLSSAARRRFWQAFTRLALADPQRAPAPSDFATLLAQTRKIARASGSGAIVLIGAGAADPELLTLRAVRALQSADIILFDDLVSSDIIEFTRREARRMPVGTTARACEQDDIDALAVALAKAGKRVVRLSAVDPAICPRARKTIAAYRAAEVAVEIVPGVAATSLDARASGTTGKPARAA